MLIITAMDIQGAVERNKDHDCNFNRTVISKMHAISFAVETEADLMTVAAEIMLRDYVPAATTVSSYAGYGQGDDNIYPII